MRMFLSSDGRIGAVGNVESYPYDVPAFVDTDYFLWQWNKVGDITLQSSWTKLARPPRSNSSIVDSDREYCDFFLKLLFRMLRDDATLTNTQRVTLLNQVQLGMNALAWGDVEVARAAFNSIATTTLWTAARKTWVLGQLDNYLAS